MKIVKILFVGLTSIFILSANAGSDEIPPSLLDLPAETQQAVFVQSNPENKIEAFISTWERKENVWREVFEPMQTVIGRNGLASLSEKREGDGRTPSGVYSLKRAFGYGETISTGLSYKQVTENDFWVDDPQSQQYNQWVQGQPQAASFERLKREDDLYKYGIVIEYNTEPIESGKGSAIFIHIWRNPQSPTAGCVALSEENLLKLLDWLQLSKNPQIILKE